MNQSVRLLRYLRHSSVQYSSGIGKRGSNNNVIYTEKDNRKKSCVRFGF